LILESIEEVCAALSSKPVLEWSDVSEITGLLKRFRLNDVEAELAMKFLKEYFLELDNAENRARLAKSAYDLFKA
jgi:hypothetical protein